jgi:restriction endonuclease Mrr
MSVLNRNGKNATAVAEPELPTFTVQVLGTPEETPAPLELGTTRLSLTEAALRVLTDHGRPMDHREICQTAMRKGYLGAQEGNSELTLQAALHEDLRRSRQRGETPRFAAAGNTFSLTKWDTDALRRQVEERNNALRDRLLGKLRTMDAARFSDCLGAILTRLGYVQEGDPVSVDGDLELKGTLTVGGCLSLRCSVLVKRLGEGSKVGAESVKALRGSLELEEHGLLVTTGDFSESARTEAVATGRRQIALVSGLQLAAMMLDFEIGVEASTLRVYDVTVE